MNQRSRNNDCPSCGAKFSKQDSECRYCGTKNSEYEEIKKTVNIPQPQNTSGVEYVANNIEKESKYRKRFIRRLVIIIVILYLFGSRMYPYFRWNMTVGSVFFFLIIILILNRFKK